MKKKDLSKIRTNSVKKLKDDVSKKKVELAKEYAEFKAGKNANIKKMRSLRRDIAQIMTIIHKRELQEKFEEKELNNNKSKQTNKQKS